MRNNRSIGNRYEKEVARYLTEQGYQILEMNFHTKFGEIDIIAKDKGYLVFVEVKYRSSERAGNPFEAVTYAKQKRICSAAKVYCMKKGMKDDTPIRFDVAGIVKERIQICKNAFAWIE